MKKTLRNGFVALSFSPLIGLVYVTSIFTGKKKAVLSWGPLVTRLAKNSLRFWVPRIENAQEFDQFPSRMKKNFRLWRTLYDIEIAEETRDVFKIMVRNCPFCEVFAAVGLSGLSPYVCRGDWELADENKDRWIFERGHQIGTGDRYCDHTYKRNNVKKNRRNAIVVGASSGMGRELAGILAANGYSVGLVARRRDILFHIAQSLPTRSFVKVIDASQPETARALLRELIAEMQDVELFVIGAGTGFINPELDWERERETIDLNVSGFTAVVTVAVEHLLARGAGHLVGISSMAALRGSGAAPAYSASKAFMSNYLEGLRQRFGKLRKPITVTDVKPGYVATAMAKGDGQFWVASPEKAALQIFKAIRKRRKRVYVTRRWRMIAWILKGLPDSLYDKL